MSENEISSKIIGAAIEVHKQLGPGLLESTYETCLAYELKQMGLDVKQQQALPVVYKEVKLDAGYRIDLLIENKVIIEIKSVEALADIHTAQLLTYLKLKDLKLGLLINFNSVRVVDGLKRCEYLPVLLHFLFQLLLCFLSINLFYIQHLVLLLYRLPVVLVVVLHQAPFV
jgi:GxxExxY protein